MGKLHKKTLDQCEEEYQQQESTSLDEFGRVIRYMRPIARRVYSNVQRRRR